MLSQTVAFNFCYDDIAWNSSEQDGADVLLIEYGPEDKPQMLTLVTKQAKAIDNMISRAVDQLNIADDAIMDIRVQQVGRECEGACAWCMLRR